MIFNRLIINNGFNININEIEILYHGTSSSRAKRIVEQGFRKGIIFFAEESYTAEYFAFESLGKYKTDKKKRNRYSRQTLPKSLTIIEFRIPKNIAVQLKIDRANRRRIGEAMDLGVPPVDRGSGHERILYNVNAFNNALRLGYISTRRLRIKR